MIIFSFQLLKKLRIVISWQLIRECLKNMELIYIKENYL
nr:MAG TPA: hypothetical protein [Bacteriophage sp.]